MKYKNGKEGISNREQSTVKSKFTDGKYFGRRSKFYFFSIKIEYNLHTNKLDYKIYIYIYSIHGHVFPPSHDSSV